MATSAHSRRCDVGCDGRNKYFDGGAIADLRIFTRALTEEEMQIVALWPSSKSRVKAFRDVVRRREGCASTSISCIASTAIIRACWTNTKHCMDEREAIARRGTVTHVQNERTDANRSLISSIAACTISRGRK